MHLFLILYLVCVILSYGFTFAFFQRQYVSIAEEEYIEDMLFAFSIAIFGPITLVFILTLKAYKHGLKFI